MRPSTRDLARAWQAYVNAEHEGVRPVTLAALQDFLELAATFPVGFLDGWAVELARRVVDEGTDIPIRLPTFRQVVGPALVRGVKSGSSVAPRILGHLLGQLAHAPDVAAELPDELRSSLALLTLAWEREPDHAGAQQALLANARYHLEYSLHELPAGVLYGANGATAAGCSDLEELLATTERVAIRAGREAEFADLFSSCRLHYRAYAEYLQQRAPGDSYAAFLGSHTRVPRR